MHFRTAAHVQVSSGLPCASPPCPEPTTKRRWGAPVWVDFHRLSPFPTFRYHMDKPAVGQRPRATISDACYGPGRRMRPGKKRETHPNLWWSRDSRSTS